MIAHSTSSFQYNLRSKIKYWPQPDESAGPFHRLINGQSWPKFVNYDIDELSQVLSAQTANLMQFEHT